MGRSNVAYIEYTKTKYLASIFCFLRWNFYGLKNASLTNKIGLKNNLLVFSLQARLFLLVFI